MAWLKEQPSREDVIWRMDEMMIRFAFQGGNVPVETTVKFLAELELQVDAYVRELRDFAKQTGMEKACSTGALAFASGIEGYEAQLAWIKRARRKLTEASS